LIAATPLIVATYKKFRKDEALSAWHQIPSNIRPCSAFSCTIWWDNGHLTKLAILSYINHNLMTDDSLSILFKNIYLNQTGLFSLIWWLVCRSKSWCLCCVVARRTGKYCSVSQDHSCVS